MDLAALIAALEVLVLERLPTGQFIHRGLVPSWCLDLPTSELGKQAFAIEEVFLFLGSFLESAEQAWRGGPSARASSGFFTETGIGGKELHLEASAIRVGQAEVLVISRNERAFGEQQLVLQRARELRLTYEALMREIEQKDVLLHTIIHDMASPLHLILGMLLLLSEQPLANPSADWARCALQAAKRQKQLIGEVLEVFSAEQDTLPQAAGDVLELRSIIEQVMAELEPIARRKEIQLEAQCASPSQVAGEARRLARIFTNLIDNALCNSPPKGIVRITTRSEGGWVWVTVDDQGEALPIELWPQLFEKFAPRRARGTGLGLYFCRITVERWGGGIGYEPREGGGSRFWVRLPMAEKRGG